MTLDELRALCDTATPGPWHKMAGAEWNVLDDKGIRILIAGTDGCSVPDGLADAAFVIAAKSALPKLLAVAEAYATDRANLLTGPLLHGDDEHKAWLIAELKRRFAVTDAALAALENP
jgi:ApbE superfamily uncharacterized protein (UPF0280 family)